MGITIRCSVFIIRKECREVNTFYARYAKNVSFNKKHLRLLSKAPLNCAFFESSLSDAQQYVILKSSTDKGALQ